MMPVVVGLEAFYLYMVRDLDHGAEIADKHSEGSREGSILIPQRDADMYGPTKAAQMYMVEHNMPGSHYLGAKS